MPERVTLTHSGSTVYLKILIIRTPTPCMQGVNVRELSLGDVAENVNH